MTDTKNGKLKSTRETNGSGASGRKNVNRAEDGLRQEPGRKHADKSVSDSGGGMASDKAGTAGELPGYSDRDRDVGETKQVPEPVYWRTTTCSRCAADWYATWDKRS